MIKKEPNRNISLRVILNATKQELYFQVGIHTPLRSIGSMLADELALDIFRVDIQFQYGYNTYKFNETRTLKQCGIFLDQETIYANIESIHTKSIQQLKSGRPKTSEKYQNLSALDLVVFHPNALTSYQPDGLLVEAVCVNSKCLNFQRQLVYPLGFGTFSMSSILHKIKCNICPYRDKNINPPVNIQRFQFKDCKWKTSGEVRSSTGFGVVSHRLKKFNTVIGAKDCTYSEILGKLEWVMVHIDIRPISQKTKNHPYLIQPNCIEGQYYSFF